MKLQNLLSSLILILLSAFASAQTNRNIGTASAGMAFSTAALHDIESSFHNQAGLADLKGFSATTYYSNAFHIAELGTKAIAVASPVGNYGTLGANFSYFGYDLYNESKYALAYAMKLGKRFSGGIQIDWFSTQFGGEYGKTGTAVGEIGIISNPTKSFYIGAHVFNPWFAKKSKDIDENVPTIMRLAASYFFAENVLFNIEAQKDLEQELIIKSGMEYSPIENAFLRIGVSSNPAAYSFGIGYNFKKFQLDFAYSSHKTLGYTTHFGLSYKFSEKSNNN